MRVIILRGVFVFSAILFPNFLNQAVAEPPVEVPEIQGFESWNALVKNLEVTMQMLTLCHLPPPKPTDGLLSHANSVDGGVRSSGEKTVSVYANDAAYNYILHREAGTFPVGSIIVKEKIRDPKYHAVNSLGIMVKRKSGFDSANADWEFIFVDNNQKVTRGPQALNNCYSCHRAGDSFGQKARDFVFVSTYEGVLARPNKAVDPSTTVKPYQ